MAKSCKQVFIVPFSLLFLFFFLIYCPSFGEVNDSISFPSSVSSDYISFSSCPSLLSCLRRLQISVNYFSDEMNVFSSHFLLRKNGQDEDEEEVERNMKNLSYVYSEGKVNRKVSEIVFQQKKEEITKDLYVVSGELKQTILHTKDYMQQHYQNLGVVFDALDMSFRKAKNLHEALRRIAFDNFDSNGIKTTKKIYKVNKNIIQRKTEINEDFNTFEYLDEIETKTRDLGQTIFMILYSDLYSFIYNNNNNNLSSQKGKSFDELLKNEKKNFDLDIYTAAEKLSNFKWKNINNMFLHKKSKNVKFNVNDDENILYQKSNAQENSLNEETFKRKINIEITNDFDYFDLCTEEKLIEMIKSLSHDVYTLTYENALLTNNTINALSYNVYKTLKYTQQFLSFPYQHPPPHFFSSDAYTANSLIYPMMYLYSQNECKNNSIYFNWQEIYELSNSLNNLVIFLSLFKSKKQNNSIQNHQNSDDLSNNLNSNRFYYLNNDSNDVEENDLYINNKFDIYNVNGRKNLIKIEKELKRLGNIIQKIANNIHEENTQTDLLYAGEKLKHFNFDLKQGNNNQNFYFNNKNKKTDDVQMDRNREKREDSEQVNSSNLNLNKNDNFVFLSYK